MLVMVLTYDSESIHPTRYGQDKRPNGGSTLDEHQAMALIPPTSSIL